MKPYFIFFFLCFLSLLVGCESVSERSIDTQEIAQQIKDRKPKYVTEAQLLEWVNFKGNEITRILQKDLTRRITQAMKEKAIKSEKEMDKIISLRSMDTLAQNFSIEIKKIPLASQENKTLGKEEKELLNQYANQEVAWESKVQWIENKQKILFTFPIILEANLVGMWAIIFPKKEAVRKYDAKELE